MKRRRRRNVRLSDDEIKETVKYGISKGYFSPAVVFSDDEMEKIIKNAIDCGVLVSLFKCDEAKK